MHADVKDDVRNISLLAPASASSLSAFTSQSHSAEETIALGIRLGAVLPVNSVVCFFGDLGAGKTTFIKGLALGAAGCDPELINSPTFSYLNIYKGFKSTIYHFDLYRLRGVDDFLGMGFEEYMQADGICCIEWSERITDLLPAHTIEVRMFHSMDPNEQNMRQIHILHADINLGLLE